MRRMKITKDDVERIINCEVLSDGTQGGQKTVFPCMINGKKYAVKFVELYDKDEFDETNVEFKVTIDSVVSRAQREINIMSSINSPYVVKYELDSFKKIEVNNHVFLVYLEEWIEGRSVFELIKSGVLSNNECLDLCHDITNAVKVLWQLSVVHRDIKPQNIMRRNENGDFVLLDMGIALDLNDKSLTAAGIIVGTEMYLSPEQLDYVNKRNIDFRSDLFSLGIVMYEAVTGKHPFYHPGISQGELFENIVFKKAGSPSKYNPTILRPLELIINRLLDKNPSGRYRKCQFLIDAVNKAKEEK